MPSFKGSRLFFPQFQLPSAAPLPSVFGLISLCMMILMETLISSARADIVKPALIEISVDTKGFAELEIKASIEAMMTGINSQFKNTTESPNAQAYDDLRVLSSPQLHRKFSSFLAQFIQGIKLKGDGQELPLEIHQILIPPTGYTKVPRISSIYLRATLARNTRQIELAYSPGFSDYAVRVKQVDKAENKWFWSDWRWIRGRADSGPFLVTEVFHKASWQNMFSNYLVIGFWHIFPAGLDHILFILGIFLLAAAWRPMLMQVTMFTIAHTITLGLSASGYISIPEWIAQPLIALSIAYIGFENLYQKQLHKHRLLLVFAFGLLHGVGFADMLKEFGMPKDDFLLALISFNIGVEFGQIAVLLGAFLLVGLWFAHRPRLYRQYISIPASLAIGLTGLYWTAERVLLI